MIKEDQSLSGSFQSIISGYGLGEFGLFSPWLGVVVALSNLIANDYQVSSRLKPDELRCHQHLFPQIVVCLTAYLQP